MVNKRATTADVRTDASGGPPEADDLALRRALRPRGPVHLGLTKRLVDGFTLIEVDGELDVLTAWRLGAEIGEVVRRQPGDVVLDLRSTGFVDSAGLHVLLTARRRLASRQRALTVVCDNGPVRRTIARARLLDALRVVKSPSHVAEDPASATAAGEPAGPLPSL
jgi:anti-sigma B factor antagonist